MQRIFIRQMTRQIRLGTYIYTLKVPSDTFRYLYLYISRRIRHVPARIRACPERINMRPSTYLTRFDTPNDTSPTCPPLDLTCPTGDLTSSKDDMANPSALFSFKASFLCKRLQTALRRRAVRSICRRLRRPWRRRYKRM
jgi:hypothetical protein